MAKNSIVVTVSLNDDSRQMHHSYSRTIYGNFTEREYKILDSELTRRINRISAFVKQTIMTSLDNYILNGEDNSNDQN